MLFCKPNNYPKKKDFCCNYVDVFRRLTGLELFLIYGNIRKNIIITPNKLHVCWDAFRPSLVFVKAINISLRNCLSLFNLKLMSSFYDKYLDIGADFGCDVGSIS